MYTCRVKEMRDLVLALMNVIPHMFAIGLLLLLIFYIFAVMFTELFKSLYADGVTSEDYFSRLDYTFFTLFQLMTMDSWSSITKEVMAVYSWAWLPFITFVVISSFIIINLVIAVICDAVAELQRNELEAQVKRINSDMAEKEEISLIKLENKIDRLTKMMDQMLAEQQRDRQVADTR